NKYDDEIMPVKEIEPKEIELKDIQKYKSDYTIGYEIYRAKKGLERFKKSYENGDAGWKKLLTSKTAQGKALQAMYLGLKPMVDLQERFARDSKEHKRIIQLCQKHVGDDFQVIGDAVFVESSVKKMLTHPEYSQHFD